MWDLLDQVEEEERKKTSFEWRLAKVLKKKKLVTHTALEQHVLTCLGHNSCCYCLAALLLSSTRLTNVVYSFRVLFSSPANTRPPFLHCRRPISPSSNQHCVCFSLQPAAKGAKKKPGAKKSTFSNGQTFVCVLFAAMAPKNVPFSFAFHCCCCLLRRRTTTLWALATNFFNTYCKNPFAGAVLKSPD